MRLRQLFFLFFISCVVLVLFTETVHGSPSPKKRQGSSDSSSEDSSSRGSSSLDESYKPYKSKVSNKEFGKDFKKAAAVGVGLDVGAKVTKKLEKAFVRRQFATPPDFGFEQWRILANTDGWLCRKDRDCSWIDHNLGCDDREFKISLASKGWPWRAHLEGQCACEDGYTFEKDGGYCEVDLSELGDLLALGAGLGAGMIALAVVMSIVGCCCCCGIVYLIIKKLS